MRLQTHYCIIICTKLFTLFKKLESTAPKVILKVFDSVVVVVFQIVFCAKIHVNDFFLFFKNYF
jgi:hypothetical protein